MSPDVVPIKDQQTVTPDGQGIAPRIEGVMVHPRPLIADKRGEIVEMYSPAWNLSPDPLVYIYQVILRPRAIKGWVVHKEQADRLFISGGVVRWVLFDNRPTSPTYRMINQFVLGERNRALLFIPPGVVHAVQNIGESDALFINMPTRPYIHENPDKYRFPLKNDLIPFSFEDGPGW